MEGVKEADDVRKAHLDWKIPIPSCVDKLEETKPSL